MSPKKKELGDSGQEHAEYVPALVVRSVAEAEHYCELLTDHDIPAVVGDDELNLDEDEDRLLARGRGVTHGVAVLVPEDLLDEAAEVIADREDVDEFRADEEDADETGDDEDFGFTEETSDGFEKSLEDDPLLEEDEEEEPDEIDDEES